MQLIVLPRKRQARQERHGKLVIIVIIITIIIISLGSSRYPSSGSDASYAWVETVKCQEATCTECKIQKGFGGRGELESLWHAFNFSLFTPPSYSFFRLSAQFSFLVTKICFPCLPCPNLSPFLPHHYWSWSLSSVSFFTACPFSCIYNSFLICTPSHEHTHTPLSPRHTTSPHCYHFSPLTVGCMSFHFQRQRNGTFHFLRNAPLPFLPHYAKSEPPQRVYPHFPEADISSYLPLANTAQLKTIFLLFVLLLWTPPTPPSHCLQLSTKTVTVH